MDKSESNYDSNKLIVFKNKNNKNVKFHKANLKNIKRFGKFRSSYEIPHILFGHNKEKKNSLKNPILDDFLKHVEAKYSIINNKNLIFKRMHSLKKMDIYNDISLILKKEQEKNNEIIFNPKFSNRNTKKIKRCKTICNNQENKFFNKNQGKKQNINKNKNNIKMKNDKVKVNNDPENINKSINKNEQVEDFVNKKRIKFLCCL